MNNFTKKRVSAFTILSVSILMLGCSQNMQTKTLMSSAEVDKNTKSIQLIAEQLYQSPAADVSPEFSAKGPYQVGVKTVSIVNPNQLDAASQTLKDRKLTLEVWYPTNDNQVLPKTVYENVTRRGTPFSLQADSYRDANVRNASSDNKYPLIVLSHGYTGYRTIMFYLGEHLASHGYIVAAIDHTDSTNAEVDMINSQFSGFVSTLLNRSRDQQFTLNHFIQNDNFLSSVIDSDNAGLIGYSMGGFGAVNTIGGCYQFNEQTGSTFTGIKDPEQVKKVMGILNSCAGGQYGHITVDKKWKAAMAFAPWGGQYGLFNGKALSNIKTPILFVSGDLDDVSSYDGIKSLFNQTGSDHKYLLTYKNARHNIAPHPAPAVSYNSELEIGHYFEPTWSNERLNNINKHFALALMDCHVKKHQDKCEYLSLSQDSNQNPINGTVPEVWKGFDHRYATGMEWQSN